MNTFYINGHTESVRPCVATIGFFDGVHKGHRFLIDKVVKMAHSMPDTDAMVITFDTHPREVVCPTWHPHLLTTLDEKLLLLSKTKIDSCAVLHFDADMAQLSAREFMQTVLHDRLHVAKLVTGYDNRFGHNRQEGFDNYVRYGKEIGMEVVQNTALEVDGLKVSSSVVRHMLSEGRVAEAGNCLGYPYFLCGKVVSGYQEGRKLGFPTANIQPNDAHKLVPQSGVYAVKLRLEGTVSRKHGMMNIGTRPTFNGRRISLEAHIFDFEDNIYGRQVEVEFVKKLRNERKFDTIGGLVAQLKADREQAIQLFGSQGVVI